MLGVSLGLLFLCCSRTVKLVFLPRKGLEGRIMGLRCWWGKG